MDAKTTNISSFNDYYNHMHKTAKDPNHPKLKLLLEYLNSKYHKIGCDIGAGTGHVGDYIANYCAYINNIYSIDMDSLFTDKIKLLNNNKLIAINGNACNDEIYKILPNKVDFLIFNSVIHELISYGCNYNIEQFFDQIWPKWLSIVNKNGLLFVRDFIGVNDDNKKLQKLLPFILHVKTQNKKKLDQVETFLNKFVNDWKEPRKKLNFKWCKHKNIIKIEDYDSLLELLLSFKWGIIDDQQYKGIIDEQFINFNFNMLCNNTIKHGYKLIKYHHYIGDDYSKTFNQYFKIHPCYQKYLTSKGVFVFQKI